ncbi:microtubule-associated protein 2-like [Uloborus diversus]|uniref:microtubule-associated protein 2-like n=1 Tax=Uloborus diversus TaxID=327109 RepID=UPI002409CAE5|nr:microtubule-associated protein 2-like [Uloborus diversus]
MFGDVQNDEKEQVSEEQDDFESMSIEELNEKLKDAVETSVDEEEVNLEAPDELNSETVEEEQNLAAVDKLNPEAADEKPITEAVEEELNPEAVKEKLNPDATEEELNPETFTEELDPEAADEQRLKAIAELSPSTIDKDKNSEAVDEEEIKLEAVDEEEITLHAAEDDKKIIQVPEENETDLDQVIDSEFKANEELISETAEQNEQQYADAEVESIECQGDSEKEDRETEAEKKDQNEILGSSDEVFKTENDNKVSEKPLQKTIVPELINLPIKPDLDVVEKSVVLEEKSSQQVICDSSKVISPRKGIKVEEDEIETAISTVQFYDESSDANEGEFVSSKISDSEQKPVALKDTGVVKSEDDENIDNEPTKKDKEEVDVGVIKKEIPLKLHSEVDGTEEKAASDATKTPTVSPKKRKRKRKVTRSRSAPQKSLHQDGVSSAAKKTQESKTAGSKGSQPEKTARSLSSGASRSASAVEKKIPPIKAPVGNAPPPKIKAARSKIGSLDNVTHKPKGGEKKVESQKLEWNAKSKVGSLDYATHKPGGGDKKILTQKVDFKNVQSKVGSKDNLKHKPGGGVVKVATEKLDFKEKAKPKVGSLDNAKHKAGGGNVSIKSEKLNFKDKASAKIHSRSESGSETQSPVQPSSPAPPESMPPLCEDDSPCSQEDQKQTNVTCNGGTGDKGAAISHEASPAISPDKVETEGKRDESNLQGNETVNGTGTQPDC